MTRLNVILFSMIVLFNCIGKNYQLIDITYYENGEIKTEIYELKEDKNFYNYIEYFENGAVKAEGKITPEGIRSNSWTYFNLDESKRAEGQYKNGLKLGIWKYKDHERSWDIFEGEEGAFRINYPSDWEQVRQNESVAVAFHEEESKDGFFENFNIYKEKKQAPLETFVETNMGKILGLVDEFELEEKRKVEINSNESIYFDFKVKSNSKSIFCRVVYINTSDYIYVISFFSLMENKEFFNEVSYSFQQ